MPANAGIQNRLKILDPGVRRDDRKSESLTFYGAVNFKLIKNQGAKSVFLLKSIRRAPILKPEGPEMYIHSYQIHNVLDVYRKRLSQGPGARPAPQSGERPAHENVQVSVKGQKKALVEQVANEIVDRLAQYGPKNRFEERLILNVDPPRVHGPLRSVQKEIEFKYTAIDENDHKTTNSLPVRHFNPVLGQESGMNEKLAVDNGGDKF